MTPKKRVARLEGKVVRKTVDSEEEFLEAQARHDVEFAAFMKSLADGKPFDDAALAKMRRDVDIIDRWNAAHGGPEYHAKVQRLLRRLTWPNDRDDEETP